MKKLLNGIASALCVMAVCVFAGCSSPSGGGGGSTPPLYTATYEFHDTVTVLTGTDKDGTYGTDGDYVLFGDFPQDVVSEQYITDNDLKFDEAHPVKRGYMEFVVGSDGNYYVKCAENAFASGSSYKYNKDGTTVNRVCTSSRWFKVMPIKWRVAATDYDVDGSNGTETANLLIAENVLTANVPYYESKDDHGYLKYASNYMYSQIRAYLNGISYNAANSANNNKWYDSANSKGKGFLQTAFGETAITSIINTEVDNSGESTTDIGKNIKWANGKNKDGTTDSGFPDYTCQNTQDKIFLLSVYEVTKYSKSGESYSSSGIGNSRIRVATDFAKANYVSLSPTQGYGAYWWLRSPFSESSQYALGVESSGRAVYSGSVNEAFRGVVPALAISFQLN